MIASKYLARKEFVVGYSNLFLAFAVIVTFFLALSHIKSEGNFLNDLTDFTASELVQSYNIDSLETQKVISIVTRLNISLHPLWKERAAYVRLQQRLQELQFKMGNKFLLFQPGIGLLTDSLFLFSDLVDIGGVFELHELGGKVYIEGNGRIAEFKNEAWSYYDLSGADVFDVYEVAKKVYLNSSRGVMVLEGNTWHKLEINGIDSIENVIEAAGKAFVFHDSSLAVLDDTTWQLLKIPEIGLLIDYHIGPERLLYLEGDSGMAVTDGSSWQVSANPGLDFISQIYELGGEVYADGQERVAILNGTEWRVLEGSEDYPLMEQISETFDVFGKTYARSTYGTFIEIGEEAWQELEIPGVGPVYEILQIAEKFYAFGDEGLSINEGGGWRELGMQDIGEIKNIYAAADNMYAIGADSIAKFVGENWQSLWQTKPAIEAIVEVSEKVYGKVYSQYGRVLDAEAMSEGGVRWSGSRMQWQSALSNAWMLFGDDDHMDDESQEFIHYVYRLEGESWRPLEIPRIGQVYDIFEVGNKPFAIGEKGIANLEGGVWKRVLSGQFSEVFFPSQGFDGAFLALEKIHQEELKTVVYKSEEGVWKTFYPGISESKNVFLVNAQLRLGRIGVIAGLLMILFGLGLLLLPEKEILIETELSEVVQKIQDARKNSSVQLNLNNLDLQSVPDAISELSSVQHIFLANNHLTELPDVFRHLKQLRSLDLAGNKLEYLPRWIDSFEQLELLSLENNNLLTIPVSLGNISSLQRLYLANNSLKSLPDSLLKLNSFEIYLHGNNQLRLPAEVLGEEASEARGPSLPNSKKILEYFFKSIEDSQPLNEAKLILVGYGEVGKTSLVRRLVSNLFDPGEVKTDGIEITGWEIEIGEDDFAQLNIWDFGGQEIMHSTHQFFMTSRSLYLLVLCGRQGHEDVDAEYWLSLIKSFGGDSPVIIVLNKYKQHPFDLNRGALREKYPAIRGFIETDCKEHFGIAELRELVKNETDRLEHLRDMFPASWMSIKNRLSGMEEDFISFEKFKSLCEENGEQNKQAQKSLAGYLHSLGIALNYRDDPRLRDLNVLNPKWVTEGIYKIINAEEIAHQKGVLNVDDLDKILDINKYPVERYAFFFELMRKFELCFAFPDSATRYLIPELLGKQQPVDALDFVPENCLNFQYEYPITPEGILPRFIVRTHVLSQKTPRWKTGVILSFEKNAALVRVDLIEKKVTINVNGQIDGRRRLLAIIRSDFERIHSTFEFEPKEMVPLPGIPEHTVPYNSLVAFEEDEVAVFPHVVSGKVLRLDVRELLTGIDLEYSRSRTKKRNGRLGRQALRLFVSYSHKDESLREQLDAHLKLMQRQNLVSIWHDRKIYPGMDWQEEIDNNLEQADIAVLLISADFMASDYVNHVELKRLLAREKSDEIAVVPIILRACEWKTEELGRLQALPKNGKPVTSRNNIDEAWFEIAKGLRSVVIDRIGRKT